jgi:hypothetical protein
MTPPEEDHATAAPSIAVRLLDGFCLIVAALRQYVAYRTRLRAELRLAPSPEIRRLLEPLLG